MEKTRVVNILHESHDVYIGRPGRGMAGPFGNRYKIGRDGTREEVLEKYRADFYEKVKDPDFRKKIEVLRGKRLGCFCVREAWSPGDQGPIVCHGQIIADWIERHSDFENKEEK